MKPLWHLGIVSSSFIMLNESTENTLYNMAQVANVTQLVGRPVYCWVCSVIFNLWIKLKTQLNHFSAFLKDTK